MRTRTKAPQLSQIIWTAILLPLIVVAGDRARHYEKIEWTWTDRPEAADPQLPNVLLLGDSITRAYYDRVAAVLNGRANVYLFATSASVGDERLVRQINDYMRMMSLRFAVVHINNGMHGGEYTDGEYKKYYSEFVSTVMSGSPTAKCIVTTTTPVRKDEPNFPTNARIENRNRTALANAARFGCAIDDQYSLMRQQGDLHTDDVHFSVAGSDLQAQQAAKIVGRSFQNIIK